MPAAGRCGMKAFVLNSIYTRLYENLKELEFNSELKYIFVSGMSYDNHI